MTRLFILGLITFCHIGTEVKDDFNFPSEFYKVNFNTATADSIVRVFGKNYNTRRGIFPYPSEESYGGCNTSPRGTSCSGHEIIEYKAEGLRFIFLSRSDAKGEKFYNEKYGCLMSKLKLEIIEIDSLSLCKFGNPERTILSFKTSDINSLFGQPEKITHYSYFEIHTYTRPESKREYDFYFQAKTSLLSRIQIKALKN